jgi:hypothetical protein
MAFLLFLHKLDRDHLDVTRSSVNNYFSFPLSSSWLPPPQGIMPNAIVSFISSDYDTFSVTVYFS